MIRDRFDAQVDMPGADVMAAGGAATGSSPPEASNAQRLAAPGDAKSCSLRSELMPRLVDTTTSKRMTSTLP